MSAQLHQQQQQLADQLAELEAQLVARAAALHALEIRVTHLENARPDDHVGPAPGKINAEGKVEP